MINRKEFIEMIYKDNETIIAFTLNSKMMTVYNANCCHGFDFVEIEKDELVVLLYNLENILIFVNRFPSQYFKIDGEIAEFLGKPISLLIKKCYTVEKGIDFSIFLDFKGNSYDHKWYDVADNEK
jgi:hypothetical protein